MSGEADESGPLLRGSYRLGETIGRGSYGKVVMAKLNNNGEASTVVIKQVSLAELDGKGRDDALREAELLSQFNHVNIIRYYDSFIEGGVLHIVMEYAPGGELADEIQRRAAGQKPFTEAEIMGRFVQIVQGLQHIHSKSILHRDLKSQNIFIGKGGMLKLGDFGISRVLGATTDMACTAIGTPYYLSPEICEDRAYNCQSDVWALGCLLYELTTLKRAFDGQSLPALVVKILKGQYPPLPTRYSSELRALVDSMLSQQPEARPTLDQLLASRFVQQHLRQQSRSAPAADAAATAAEAASSCQRREDSQPEAAADPTVASSEPEAAVASNRLCSSSSSCCSCSGQENDVVTAVQPRPGRRASGSGRADSALRQQQQASHRRGVMECVQPGQQRISEPTDGASEGKLPRAKEKRLATRGAAAAVEGRLRDGGAKELLKCQKQLLARQVLLQRQKLQEARRRAREVEEARRLERKAKLQEVRHQRQQQRQQQQQRARRQVALHQHALQTAQPRVRLAELKRYGDRFGDRQQQLHLQAVATKREAGSAPSAAQPRSQGSKCEASPSGQLLRQSSSELSEGRDGQSRGGIRFEVVEAVEGRMPKASPAQSAGGVEFFIPPSAGKQPACMCGERRLSDAKGAHPKAVDGRAAADALLEALTQMGGALDRVWPDLGAAGAVDRGNRDAREPAAAGRVAMGCDGGFDPGQQQSVVSVAMIEQLRMSLEQQLGADRLLACYRLAKKERDIAGDWAQVKPGASDRLQQELGPESHMIPDLLRLMTWEELAFG